jgi:hypothetical protein
MDKELRFIVEAEELKHIPVQDTLLAHVMICH